MELDFDKYCVVDGSPTTVLPSPGHRPKAQKRKSKGYATRENSLLSVEEDFHVISLSRYRSRSCKTISSRTVPLEYSDARKRGSVCHKSSKELRLSRKTDASEGRKKIELSETSAAALSFGIVDSLCSSDEENSHIELDRSLEMSLNLESSTTSKSRERLHRCEFLDLPVLPASWRGVPSHGLRKVPFDMDSAAVNHQQVEKGAREYSKINSRPVIPPLYNDGNSLGGKGAEAFLHKSLSAKLSLPHSPVRSETDSSRASSPKTRFGPAVRKVFDPFVKSKSQRSPLGSLREQQREASIGSDNIHKNKIFRRKTLLHDFANTGQQMEYISSPVKQCHNRPVQSSPAHLQALLKLDRKHGLPIFEFSVKSPEDVFVARTWKSENASDWIYTFHSTPEKRRSNASRRGAKESKKGSSLMGQMQVSCHSCTELKDAGFFKDSMVTEFILYDVAHSRSTSSNDSSLQDTTRGQLGQGRHSGSSYSSSSHPLNAAELHPHCEAAAIVVQFPSGKRESLKQKNGDKKLDDTYDFIQRNNEQQLPDCSSPAKVNVVIPSGNHSLPTAESHGPSPLLDRWRSGGGCDCGGWDMACPLNIFVNPDIQISGDHHLMESKQPLELFIQVILPYKSCNLHFFSDHITS